MVTQSVWLILFVWSPIKLLFICPQTKTNANNIFRKDTHHNFAKPANNRRCGKYFTKVYIDQPITARKGKLSLKDIKDCVTWRCLDRCARAASIVDTVRTSWVSVKPCFTPPRVALCTPALCQLLISSPVTTHSFCRTQTITYNLK